MMAVIKLAAGVVLAIAVIVVICVISAAALTPDEGWDDDWGKGE
jgi:hypothetical protein